jgi:RNA polymerase sigma-70 factor (ECF subfamily)
LIEFLERPPVKLEDSEIERLTLEGARRLLARASESRSLKVETLQVKVRRAVEKYLLLDDAAVDAKAVAEFVDGLQADDLCLIVACESGDQNAWGELVERFSPTVRSAARSASANEDAAEDLAQSIWAELYGLRARTDGKPAGKLGYYSGRGSLAGWLRAVVAQLAVDEHRRQSRLVQTEEETDLERLAREATATGGMFGGGTVPVDPEQSVTNQETGLEVQEALACSIRELSPEDRLLVKLYYFDNLRLRAAGALLGVHEATASRRLSRIHGELRRRVGAILVEQRGWTEAETERTFNEVAINLQGDIEAMLETQVAPGGKEAKIPR